MRKGLGYIPDLPDDRDMNFTTLWTPITTPPPKRSNRHLIAKILRQLWLGSCAGMATVQALHADAVRQLLEADPTLTPKQAGELIEYASALLAYLFGRMQHGDKANDSGTYIRAILKAINRLGFCRESLWPYNPNDFRGPPPTEALQEAIDCAPTPNEASDVVRYRRIWSVGDARIDEIKLAIANDRLVIQGADITREMADFGHGFHVFDTPKSWEEIAGGHAWPLVGYDDERRIIEGAGSWGDEVHDDGFHWITYDFAAYHSRDLWVVEFAPTFPERLRLAA